MSDSIDPEIHLPVLGDYYLEKGAHNIHHQMAPGAKFNLMQVKTLNVMQYLLQKRVNEIGFTPEQYLREHPGNLTSHIKLSELCLLTGVKSTNSKFLKKLSDEMTEIKFAYGSLIDDQNEEHGVKGEFGFVNMINFCTYARGKIEYMLPPYTVRFLLLNTNSAKLDLLQARSFNCKYGYFLYEHVEEFAAKEQKEKLDIILEHKEILSLFRITYVLDENKQKVYSYSDPATVKNKVVKNAVLSFNEADLRYEIVDYSYRKSKGIVYWHFSLVSKRTLVVQEFTNKNALEIAEAKKRLQQFGVSEDRIRKLLDTLNSDYELSYLFYNLDKVKEAVKRNDVSNAAGLFVRCHENNKAAFDEIWGDLQKEKEAARLLKKIQFEKKRQEEKAKYIKELIDNRCLTLQENLRQEPSKFAEYIFEFGEYLSNIPTPSAKKMKSDISEGRITLRTIDDPIFQKFLESHVAKNTSDKDKERYIAEKGTYFADI